MEKNELTNTIQATLCPRAVLIAYTYAQGQKSISWNSGALTREEEWVKDTQ